MLWTIVAILLVMWVLGLVFHIAGGLIHFLLVAAVIVFIFNFIKGRARP
ncbi:MAG: lmo0937 family membrane protein [Bacillota bacterium]|nr:lmo0937 family membrane protein [Bacillota bacterium]MDP4169355.1 lmo0937 family membrane protein [Bacillota bacterium]